MLIPHYPNVPCFRMLAIILVSLFLNTAIITMTCSGYWKHPQCVFVCVCVWCVHACMRACVRACVCVCVYNAMQRIWATSKSKECYQQGMHTPGGQTLHHCGKHSVTSTCRDCRQLAALIRAIETKVLSCLI